MPTSRPESEEELQKREAIGVIRASRFIRRFAGNLILERYGLVGISIKIEKENKNRYRQALSQIDTVKDYEPLKTLIYEGLTERYEGVNMKY